MAKRSYFLLLFFFFFFVIVEATTVLGRIAVAEAERRPGFIYTRARGRCTPQFWSSAREAWPRMVPQEALASRVFGSRTFERYKINLTLLEAAERNDDGNDAFSSLLKQATAALLNSYVRKGFPYNAWEVKTLVIQALISEKAATLQAQQFSIANEACN